eukprot:GEMP01071334.1.p1 GENE.GEMP01071334.1~~GEMP01071334.1.p1  ORF type:complete len:205 (+),score=35.46 GEMP01071334.1:140-754(+)
MNLGWSALTDVAGGAEDLIMLIFGESITETKATDEGECKEGAGQAGSAGQARGMLAPWIALMEHVLHDQSVDTFAYGKLTVPGLGDNTDAIANRNLSRLEEIEQEKTNTGEACFVDILAPSRETQAADADIIDRGSQNLSKSDSQDRLSFVHGRRLSNVSEALNLPMDVVRRSSTGTVKVVDATGDGNLCNNLTIVRLDPQANI